MACIALTKLVHAQKFPCARAAIGKNMNKDSQLEKFATDDFKEKELRDFVEEVKAYHIAYDIVLTQASFKKALNRAFYEMTRNLKRAHREIFD